VLRRFSSPGIGVLALLWLFGDPTLSYAQRDGGFRGGFNRGLMPGTSGSINPAISRGMTPGMNGTSMPAMNTTIASPFNRMSPTGSMGVQLTGARCPVRHPASAG
jgi:hypothetical protein